MINVGIIGADTPDGGELIRLLAMHPDVELMGAQASGLDGVPVSRVHHGLIGETDLRFSSTLDYARLNVLFVCSDVQFGVAEFTQMRIVRPDLKVIMLRAPKGIDMAGQGIVYGLPELNRKLLVRGATGAIVPTTFASMALVALIPFAMHLLLSGEIDIHISAPEAIIKVTDTEMLKAEIEEKLREIQRSFNGSVKISLSEAATRRSAKMTLRFPSALSQTNMLQLYDVYDDHNFSFAVENPAGVSEVAGTNKIVVTVGRTDMGEADITAVADCRLRGAAGEAMHIMNLMFGLHEKTGLALKAIDFFPVDD